MEEILLIYSEAVAKLFKISEKKIDFSNILVVAVHLGALENLF